VVVVGIGKFAAHVTEVSRRVASFPTLSKARSTDGAGGVTVRNVTPSQLTAAGRDGRDARQRHHRAFVFWSTKLRS
jgi:hypothetical protein